MLVSAALIGYLLATAKLDELAAMLKSWHAIYFFIAVLLEVVRNVIFAYRWKITLSVSGIKVPFPTLVRFYFVGAFFNLFLPTALGGDVVRGYNLAVRSGKKVDAATSVLVERIVLLGSGVIEDATVTTVILFVCLGYFALTMLVFNASIMRRLIGALEFVKFWDLSERLGRIYDSLYKFTAHKALLLQCFALSIICQTLAILAAYSLALAINLKLDLVYFFMVLPMIWIITMVPLSINGLGVREGAFVFFFTTVGAPDSAALLLSFLNFSQMIVLGLMGGIIYLFGQIPPMITARQKKVN
jgi:uncharacterized membrane protein YbhN (UPF0104 family)